jgi:hypothetical protein
VGVVAGDQAGAVARLRPRGVAQGDAGGHPGRPDQDGHRPGVLLAVAALQPQEVDEVVAAGTRLGGEAVDESVVPVGQVVVDAPDLLVRAAGPGDQGGDEVGDRRVQLGQPGEALLFLAEGQQRRGGGEQRRRGARLHGRHAVAQLAGAGVAPEHGAGGGVEPPVAGVAVLEAHRQR